MTEPGQRLRRLEFALKLGGILLAFVAFFMAAHRVGELEARVERLEGQCAPGSK